jgi:non-heme chloroperoxidase
MKARCLWIFLVGLFFAAMLPAQDLSGTWQGTLKADQPQRIVLQVARNANGGWRAKFYNLDQSDQATDPRALAFFTMKSGRLEFSLDQDAGRYTGTLNAGGNTIAGTWTQGKALPLTFARVAKAAAWKVDATPHKVQFVAVEKGVRLEVLDWGGSGRPLILLPGLGDTAHVFDVFAQKLAANYHVYGITTRGFGDSSAPAVDAANYSAERLGEDVIAVIDALKLERPILAGHSVAGEYLSSVATRYPKKIAAVIYIDAGYPYALYDKAHGDLVLDTLELRRKLDAIHVGVLPRDPKELDAVLAGTKQAEAGMQQRKEDYSTISTPHPIQNAESVAILDGQEKYFAIEVPVLAIFNVPHSPVFLRTMEYQVKAFETQVPQAEIIRIAQADHYVFQSNEAEVLRDMNAFIAKLP